MRTVRWTFAFHLLALGFGLAGILIAMPHPELWAGHPALVKVYTFGMQHGGASHIIFGALTMVAFGVYAIGWRKTLIFALTGSLIPLCLELLGTGTGWPFGGYAYTEYLGTKVADRVPYSVPLSWFYMGFASYLLALIILAQPPHRAPVAERPAGRMAADGLGSGPGSGDGQHPVAGAYRAAVLGLA